MGLSQPKPININININQPDNAKKTVTAKNPQPEFAVLYKKANL